MSVYRPGITKKRLRNKRFGKTEEAFAIIVLSKNGNITVDAIANEAGVARSTFYRHHQSIGGMITDYRKYVLREYSLALQNVINDDRSNMPELCRRTLAFILQNKRIFWALAKMGDLETFNQIAYIIRPKVSTILHLPKNADKLYRILAIEIAAPIIDWCASGLPTDDLPRLRKHILYLTNTARNRLKMLN